MRKVSRRAKEEGVSPVIATILMVAITVVLSAVLYVLVSEYLKPTDRTENIGLVCVKGADMNYRCSIRSTTGPVDFTQVNVLVRDKNETLVAQWGSPIQFVSGVVQATGTASPLETAKILDQGDKEFGLNDDICLAPLYGKTLVGITIKVSGGHGDGSVTIV